MEILKKIGEFLLSGIPFLAVFLAGRASKEKAILKEENKKLKDYKKIDDREVQKNEVYDHNNW